MALLTAGRARRSTCASPECHGRLRAGGREIAEPQELMEESERVAAVILRNPYANSYVTLMVDGFVLPALAAVEASYAGDRWSGLDTLPDSGLSTARWGVEGVTLDRFGLCSEHARRVARAFIIARLYTDLWPDSPLPLAPVFYEAGRVTKTQPWTPWAVAVLLRIWAVGGLSISALRAATHTLQRLADWCPVLPEDIEDERKRGYPTVMLRLAVALLAKKHILPVATFREGTRLDQLLEQKGGPQHYGQHHDALARPSSGTKCAGN